MEGPLTPLAGIPMRIDDTEISREEVHENRKAGITLLLSRAKAHQVSSVTGRVTVANRLNTGNFRLLGSRASREDIDVVVVTECQALSTVLSDY